MKRIGRILALALAFGLHVTACGSEARATAACEEIEYARCERGAQCLEGFLGDVGSCQRFYKVQCGRGVPESAKEPSRAELKTCVDLIKSDTTCEAVKDPARFCPFLVANDQPAVVDSGVSLVPDMGTVSDAPADGG
jgi:hypothetical protein